MTTSNFATGAGHVNLPQASDKECANCHKPQGETEYDASIKGAHMVATRPTQLAGVIFEHQPRGQRQTRPEDRRHVRVRDKNGNPMDITKMDSPQPGPHRAHDGLQRLRHRRCPQRPRHSRGNTSTRSTRRCPRRPPAVTRSGSKATRTSPSIRARSMLPQFAISA